MLRTDSPGTSFQEPIIRI